jgi:hypothetical protein
VGEDQHVVTKDDENEFITHLKSKSDFGVVWTYTSDPNQVQGTQQQEELELQELILVEERWNKHIKHPSQQRDRMVVLGTAISQRVNIKEHVAVLVSELLSSHLFRVKEENTHKIQRIEQEMRANNHGNLPVYVLLEGVVLQGQPDLRSNCHRLRQVGDVLEPDVTIPHEAFDVSCKDETDVFVTANEEVR